MTQHYPLFWKWAHRFLSINNGQELYLLYTEPHRFYHNIDHIERLLGLMEEHVTNVDGRVLDILAAAILFHDAAYYINSKHNEELSAAYGAGKLRNQFNSSELNLLERIILATKSHTHSKWDHYLSLPMKAMLDFDLWDIGSDWNTFYQNTVKIRAEFGNVPTEEFARGRRAFFQTLLDSPRIFREFTDREEQARANLVREYDLLASDTFRKDLDTAAFQLRVSPK
ncbi:putative metal-dependent phosphohydrolase protein [Rhizobium phage RHph_I42]|nr:putative metal-dependent phosphohydrolase protein [Rhizobium phage RHph_I42]